MPHFHEQALFHSEDAALTRYACDGHDDPRPGAEEVGHTQLMFVLAGSFELRGSSGRDIADPSAVFLFAGGEEHVIRHPHGAGDVCLTLRGRVAERLTRERRGRVNLRPNGLLALHQLVKRSASLNKSWPGIGGVNPPAGAIASLNALQIEETVSAALDDDTAAPKGPRDLADAIAHEVALHFQESRSLDEIARAVGVSTFHACRVFRRARGTTIHQHRESLRLAHATALLLDTDRSIAEIASDVGFSSQAHLTHRLARAHGHTPGALRRLSRTDRADRRPSV